MLSVLDIFRVGIGPSSSHTVGPIRIGARFIARLQRDGCLARTDHIQVRLEGSLALTGEGHATPRAVAYGLLGFEPETMNAQAAEDALAALHNEKAFIAAGQRVRFDPGADIQFDFETLSDVHPNGMEFTAFDAAGAPVSSQMYYSTGGGFIASRDQLLTPLTDDIVPSAAKVPYPFACAADLLEICADESLSVADVILANENATRPREATQLALDYITHIMMACIDRGLKTPGVLPGGLKVNRRAPKLWDKLKNAPLSNERESLFDWLNLYAMAVNEENAAGGQVVTAPTNGAAGIIPSLIKHYCSGADGQIIAQKARIFLLTAGGIGLLYKQRASISGAEMGCQGEVGVACSMAAAGLAAVWNGSPLQIASAAEIGMEHNLGLTCDPVGGLVQIPCIERNAIGASKAVNAARLALHSDEVMKVSLDQVIETMRQTGLDMSSKYKETSQGGLAVNVVAC